MKQKEKQMMFPKTFNFLDNKGNQIKIIFETSIVYIYGVTSSTKIENFQKFKSPSGHLYLYGNEEIHYFWIYIRLSINNDWKCGIMLNDSYLPSIYHMKNLKERKKLLNILSIYDS